MVEIIHQDYEKNKSLIILLSLLFFILAYLIPIVILIADPMNLFGISLLIIFTLLLFFFTIHYNYRYHISTIITKDNIILKSLKRKTYIQRDDVRYVEEIGYITIKTLDKNYTITSTDIDTKNKIILEFINRGYPVRNKDTIINNDQNEIESRKIPHSKFVNSAHKRFYTRSKRILITGSIIISIPMIFLLIEMLFNIRFPDLFGNETSFYMIIFFMALGGITIMIGIKMIFYCLIPKNRKKWDKYT